MSVTGNFRRVTPEELAFLQEDPLHILPFFGHSNEEEEAEWDDEDELEAEEAYYAFCDDLKARDVHLWIDKAWDALHFLLNGQAEGGETPLRWAVMGNEELPGKVDVGYGPASFLTAAEVKAISELLEALTEDDLRRNFDLDAMNAAPVYPASDTDREPTWVQESFPWLWQTFESVRRFYQIAAANGEAMLLWLN